MPEKISSESIYARNRISMSDSKQYINSYSMVFSNSEIYEGLFQPFKNIFPHDEKLYHFQCNVDKLSPIQKKIIREPGCNLISMPLIPALRR